jgi:hypothetical protein
VRHQVVYFFEVTEPYPSQTGVPQFIDAHMSIGYSRSGSAWSESVPTVSATTELFARIRVDATRTAWCRVPSVAMMALVGWPPELLKAQPPDEKLLQSFAGNAFSAFSVGVLQLGILSCMDLDALDDASE